MVFGFGVLVLNVLVVCVGKVIKLVEKRLLLVFCLIFWFVDFVVDVVLIVLISVEVGDGWF